MRITLIGGHGKVALLLAPKLVEAGYEVTSLVRNPDHEADVAATGARPRVVDVEQLDVDELAAVLDGQDALVWAAGAGGGSQERTRAVDQDAAIRSMDAAAAAGVERYVMVSYLGSGTDDQPHGVDPADGFWSYAEAKTHADAHLRASDLGWTVLKPSALTTAPSRGTLDPDPSGAGDTSRELVADVALAVLSLPLERVRGLEIGFTDGDVPIGSALAQAARRG